MVHSRTQAVAGQAVFEGVLGFDDAALLREEMLDAALDVVLLMFEALESLHLPLYSPVLIFTHFLPKLTVPCPRPCKHVHEPDQYGEGRLVVVVVAGSAYTSMM